MMTVFVIDAGALKLYREYEKIYPSRSAAFRAAKRDAKIPMGQQSSDVIKANIDIGATFGLDERNVRLYIFNLLIGAVAIEYHKIEQKITLIRHKYRSATEN